MARNPNVLFLYQAFVAFCIVTFVSMGLVTALALFYLQESRDSRRPGIDLKKL